MSTHLPVAYVGLKISERGILLLQMMRRPSIVSLERLAKLGDGSLIFLFDSLRGSGAEWPVAEILVTVVNRRASRTSFQRPTLTRVGRLFEGSSVSDFICG
jgi:hypothetical protein